MLEENDLQCLLRLKRYERPAPGFEQRFLEEFHRRQRDQLIRTPAWKLAYERLHALLDGLQIPRVAYAGTLAAFILLAATLAIRPMAPPTTSTEIASAVQPSSSPAASLHTLTLASTSGDQPGISLGADRATAPETVYAASTVAHQTPRYVLDARPVSYDPPFSF